MLQGKTDIVLPQQQPFLQRRFNVEVELNACRRNDCLLVQVDSQAVALTLLNFAEQLFNLRHGKHKGQQAVFTGIGIEDIAVTRRDHTAETVLVQGPHGMFPG